MTAEQWLMLTDYASKYRISVSTLRRRIKAHQIPFRMDGGKYYILDAPPSHPEIASFGRETPIFPGLKTFAVEPAPTHVQAAREYPTSPIENEHWELHDLNEARYTPPKPALDFSPGFTPEPRQAARADEVDEPLISTATKLLNELKQAYMNILHEKEEQIIQLKAEVSDLKTLVRVLEDDNDRMRRLLTPPHPR